MFQLFDQGGRYYRARMHDTRYLQFLIIQWHVKYRMDGKKMELGVGEFACYQGGGMEEKDNVKNTEFLCRGDIQFTNSFFFFFYSYFVGCCCCLCSWKTEPPQLSGTKKRKGTRGNMVKYWEYVYLRMRLKV